MSTDRELQSSYRFCAALVAAKGAEFFLCVPALARVTKAVDVRALRVLAAYGRPGRRTRLRRRGKPRRSMRGGSSSTPRWPGGRVDWPGLPALADTIARHGIPAHLLHEVIDGRVDGRRAAPLRDVRGSGGLLLSCRVGRRPLLPAYLGLSLERGKAEKLAEHCGIALQLTNIIRDVREDARNGRIYLPTEDLERFGVAPEELTAGGPPSERLRACSRSRPTVRVSILRAGASARAAGRSGGQARASDDRRDLPRLARRDREPELQRHGRSRVCAAVAKSSHRAASAGRSVHLKRARRGTWSANVQRHSESIVPLK